MAYNSTEFILKEGTIQYGTWTDPHLLTPASDPTASFSATDTVGYIRMGTQVYNIADERVEYLTNTPHEIVRRDLLRRNYFWNFVVNQFNKENMALFKNMEVQTGAWTIAWIGPDIPVATRYGWLVTGYRVDGTAIYWAIWSGEVSTEDNNVAPSGTDYVDINVMIQAFAHSSFGITAQDNRRKYGAFFMPESS